MIVKTSRNCDEKDRFDLKVIDKNDNDFFITVGGNLDLYWVPNDYKNIRTFYIDKSDSMLFDIFTKLFEDIKKNDNKYSPTLNGNKFKFISEDYPEEDANILEIDREKEQFIINFIKTEGVSVWGKMKRGCPICFCNSGSRVPEVESLFMHMFNNLAYYSDEIELERE